MKSMDLFDGTPHAPAKHAEAGGGGTATVHTTQHATGQMELFRVHPRHLAIDDSAQVDDYEDLPSSLGSGKIKARERHYR